MKHDGEKPTPTTGSPRPGDKGYQGDGAPYLSTRGLVIVLAAIAIALVLGYLLLNKLVDMSQEEDCALAHRHNCAAVQVPR